MPSITDAKRRGWLAPEVEKVMDDVIDEALAHRPR